MGLGSLVLLIVLLALLITSGVFIVRADDQVEALPNYSSDSNLLESHRKLKDASVTVWVGFAGIVVLILLYMFFGSETEEFTGRFVIYFFILLTVIVCILVGVFSIQSIGYLKNSSNYQSSSSSADKDIIISIVLTIGVIALLFILMLIKAFSGSKSKSKSKASSIEGEASQLATSEV